MSYNIVRPEAGSGGAVTRAAVEAVRGHLGQEGWALLRGFRADMEEFSALVGRLCGRITFDPAREYSGDNTQKVDAGLGPIGLHVENGNTPRCPDIVAFYARRAAFEGSQTTICDGAKLFEAFDDGRRARWSQKMTVSRRLPEIMWKRYLANEHPAISRPEEVTMQHIQDFGQAVPGQDFEMYPDGSILYSLTVDPVRRSNLAPVTGFANAVLGPSHNYETPRYVLADGSEVSRDEIEDLRALAEPLTVEINWQDGDIAVLDSTRIMHGRRAIKDPERELYIGMGTL